MELIATVMVVDVTAVTRARRPLIWVMPRTPVGTTESPTTKGCPAPTLITAWLAWVMPVTLRVLFAASVTNPVAESTSH
ncbi:hypothetical protein D9M70_549790 [compost metagenome]